jgi:hypothetical protein
LRLTSAIVSKVKTEIIKGNLTAFEQTLGAAPIVGRVNVDPFAGVDNQRQDALAVSV